MLAVQEGEFLYHEPCEKCGSSDAKAVYSTGTSYCFSCQAYFKDDVEVKEQKEEVIVEKGDLPKVSFFDSPRRGITLETFNKFGYGYLYYKKECYHVAPYYYKNKLVAYHLRSKDKEFRWWGETDKLELFGQRLWKNSGEYRTRIVITEGEVDALSVSQAFGNKYAVVSIPSGAQSAKKYLLQNLEFLEGYSEICLGFDNDEAGKKATEECIPLFTPGKVKVIDWGIYKDANEMLQAGKQSEICQCVYNAQVYRPDGIVFGEDLWDDFKKDLPVGTYIQYPEFNKKTCGLRKNEIIMFTAGSGIGKSTLVNEIGHHLLTKKDQKIGVVALEETCRRTADRYVGMELNKPIHISREGITEVELKQAFDVTIGSGRMFLYDHFGSLESSNLISKIRYMVVALKCDFIILDHISIAISGNESKDERKDIDILMTNLRSMVGELDFGLLCVVHVKRKTGSSKSYNDGGQVSLSDLRGSGALEQLSDIVIALERNQQAEDEDSRNTTQIRILKNRFTGETGVCDTLFYYKETGRLLPIDDPLDVVANKTIGGKEGEVYF